MKILTSWRIPATPHPVEVRETNVANVVELVVHGSTGAVLVSMTKEAWKAMTDLGTYSSYRQSIDWDGAEDDD